MVDRFETAIFFSQDKHISSKGMKIYPQNRNYPLINFLYKFCNLLLHKTIRYNGVLKPNKTYLNRYNEFQNLL